MKEHPYDYITPENFELIKNTISMGLSANKTPKDIATIMAQATGLDHDVCYGLVQAELLPTMEELEKKDV